LFKYEPVRDDFIGI